jgi:hypothetical protein
MAKYLGKGGTPHDAAALMSRVARDEFSNEVVSEDIKLGNIADDQLLSLLQIQVHSLVSLDSMAVRDPELALVADVLRTSWRNGINLTKAKDGGLIKLVASFLRYSPREDPRGQGSEEDEEEVSASGLIDKIKKLGKRG